MTRTTFLSLLAALSAGCTLAAAEPIVPNFPSRDAMWSMADAGREKNACRERISLNGLWAFQVDNEAMTPFLRESMLSMTTSIIPEGVSPEDVGKEIDAGIAESHMQATMEQFSATEVDLATGWTTQWWNKRRVTITSDEGERQTVAEKEVIITDE